MQENCLAMGNWLTVVAANCFVFTLERKLFSILPARLLFWIRYIDDVIAICDKTIISEDLLVTKLKDLHPNIIFTYCIIIVTRRRDIFKILLFRQIIMF